MSFASGEDPASSLLSKIVSSWRAGDKPNALQVLSQHPDLVHNKSFVLDLAYEEYCLRCEAGEPLAASTFCEQFPTYRRSLRRLIDVHQYLEHDPKLARSLTEAEFPKIGDQFLGFEIQRELGRGAFARVYLALERALGNRPVAIKVSAYGAGEAETLGRLSHQNVVQVHAVYEDSDTGTTAVCMPFLGAATLSDVLDQAFVRGKPPAKSRDILRVARASVAEISVRGAREEDDDRLLARSSYVDGIVYLGAQLADALAYTHRNGILHRDLKPSNVLLTPYGRPVLLDFNLSTDEEIDGGRIGGTLPYMPPEQIREVFMPDDESGNAVDSRSDVYSLGVILYELLTGRLPFGGLSSEMAPAEAGGVLLERQQTPPTDVRSINPSVGARTSRTIQRCLDPDPAQRPQSAEELRRLLRQELAVWRRATRWSRRHPVPVALFAVALLTLVSFVSWHFATLPPYEVRQLHKAAIAYEDERYPDALVALDSFVDEDCQDVRALTLRAMTNLHLSDYPRASLDFQTASTLTKSPFLHAFRAYCATCLRLDDPARSYGETALKQGQRSAPVLNNLGLNYRRLADQTSDPGQEVQFVLLARENLDAAIVLDPMLAPAHLNRALVELDLLIRQNQRPILIAADLSAAIEHANDALRLAPDSADSFAIAARAYELRARIGDSAASSYASKGSELLRRAIELGFRADGETLPNSYPGFDYQSVLTNLAPARAGTGVRRDLAVSPSEADILALMRLSSHD